MSDKDPLVDALLKPRLMSRWIRIPTAAGESMAIVSGIFIVVLMLLTVSDMTLRKFFSSGVPGAVEINEVVLVAIVFLALTSAEMTDTNVRTPLVTERLPNTGTKGQAFRDEWKTALKAMDTKYSSYVDPTTTCAERF